MDEHITVTIKKATQLYVVGGVAHDIDVGENVFWYAIRSFPVMSRRLQQETGTKSLTEYIQQNRPEWGGGEPPEEYREFYKGLPEVFEEGSPKQIERAKPGKIGQSVTIVPPTKVKLEEEATGDPQVDVPIVEAMIRRIREIVWRYPVSGAFTGVTGLQSEQLRDFINTNLKKAFTYMKMRKFAQNLQVIPQTVRYIDVATGTIFTSEEEVKQAIEEYHTEEQPMLAAASKGGKVMRSIGELLKIADLLDEKGDPASADEIMEIVKQIAEENDQTQQPEQDETLTRAWLGNVIQTLVRVADSLDGKGATKEAQIADQLLQSLQQDLPQAFRQEPAGPSHVEAPVVETPEAQAPEIETPVEEIPTDLVVEETEVEGTPFSELPEETESQGEAEDTLREVDIEEPTEPEPEYDEMTIDEFKGLIDSMRWRHSQGPKRQKYEQVLEHIEKAKEYFDAYREWSEYAHKLFEDEPIRIKID